MLGIDPRMCNEMLMRRLLQSDHDLHLNVFHPLRNGPSGATTLSVCGTKDLSSLVCLKNRISGHRRVGI